MGKFGWFDCLFNDKCFGLCWGVCGWMRGIWLGCGDDYDWVVGWFYWVICGFDGDVDGVVDIYFFGEYYIYGFGVVCVEGVCCCGVVFVDVLEFVGFVVGKFC